MTRIFRFGSKAISWGSLARSGRVGAPAARRCAAGGQAPGRRFPHRLYSGERAEPSRFRWPGRPGAILQARRRARPGVAADRQRMDNADRRGKDARRGDHPLRCPGRHHGDRDRRAKPHRGLQGNRTLCQASGEAWRGCHHLYCPAWRDRSPPNCCLTISGWAR